MPYTTTEIKKYRCALMSNAENSAKVQLYNANDSNFATVYIRPDSEPHTVAFQDETGMTRLYYKRSNLQDLIDLLRNEKPVFLQFWTGAGDNTHIGTGMEPVGEREV